jgi:hypothetical protein
MSILYEKGPLPSITTPKDFTGAYDLSIYAVETTQRFIPGTKFTRWDGAEFRYAKSGSAVIASEACYFAATGYTAITAFAVAGVIGDTQVTVPAATHAALTKDELVGGYIVIFTGGADNQDNQCRLIIGNDAAAASALFKVTMDGPLTSTVVVTTSSCETYQNPWANMTHTTGSSTLAKAGVPAVYVSATGYYFWVQTRGPIFVNPQSGVVGAKGMGCFWRNDGSIEDANAALAVTTATYGSSQYAGHIIEGSYDGNGPLFMLQGP